MDEQTTVALGDPGPPEFLSQLFGAALDDDGQSFWILVWSLPSKKSSWCTTIADAEREATRLNNLGEDVYFGIGLSPKNMGPNHRCMAKDIGCLVGLWADIDIMDPVHKKPGLAGNVDIASRIATLRLRPTIIIHSGHGLQAYWLFKEPWIITDPDEHRKAETLCNLWQRAVEIDAKTFGAVIDATHDMSRVLRMPGTLNRKSAPMPVYVVEIDPERRYDIDDIEAYLPDVSPDASTMPMLTSIVRIGHLELRADAAPPFEKFQAMMDADKRFKATWDRQRRDFKDQSPSAYDLSLAGLAIGGGWSDQEIANLLIAARKKHNDDLKLREDYYGRTIAKAREGRVKGDADEAFNVLMDEIRGMSYAGIEPHFDDPDKKRHAVDVLSVQLGFPIARIVQYIGHGGDTNKSQYAIISVNGRRIDLEKTESLTSQEHVRNRVFEAWGYMIPNFKPERWREHLQLIGVVIDLEEMQFESSVEGQVSAWIAGYIADRHVLPSKESAVSDHDPYLDIEGCICIFGNNFRTWLKMTQMETISQIKMGAMLRQSGCELKTEPFTRKDGSRTTRSIWRIPKGYAIELRDQSPIIDESYANDRLN